MAMAFSSILCLLLLSFFSGEISMLVKAQKAWCVAKPGATPEALQLAVDYACSNADCKPTSAGGSCYEPNTPVHHASFSMNAYYQQMGRNSWNCEFSNTSLIALTDPSYDARCPFMSGGPGPSAPQRLEDTFCVPKPGTPDDALKVFINFACEVLKDCSKIQEQGSCYFPNTLMSHAAFLMNLYYKTVPETRYNCNFNGIGTLVVTNPSYGTCIYA